MDAENLNVSLYNYVHDLTSEMDTLEIEIQGIRAEIEKFRGHGVNNEKNRDSIMDKLQLELQETETVLKKIEKEYTDTMRTINALKLGIQSIFNRVRTH